MKKIILFLLIASLFLSQTSQSTANPPQKPTAKAPSTAWKEYVSTAGNFAVLLPSGQILEEKNPQIRVKLDVGPRTYGVARLEGFKFAESAQATVEGAAEDFIKTSEGKAINKFNTPLGDLPGATVKFETMDPPGITEARFYLVGKYMYAVIAFTRNGSSQDDGTKFLNSFRLLNYQPGKSK